MSTTGEHPAVQESKPPTLSAAAWQLAGLIFKREALMLVAAMAVLTGAGGATVVYGQGYLDGGTAKAIAPVKADLATVKTKAEATDKRIDALDAKFDNAEERNARRFEVLYNAILERRPQAGAEELMRTDGGR
ncbi:MAG: hypothetical protein Q8K32_10980 [Archangium sp.]|nr:hypothetical protein [Archangium sp.]